MSDYRAHQQLVLTAARRLPTYSARLALQQRLRAERSRKIRSALLFLAIGLLIGAFLTGLR